MSLEQFTRLMNATREQRMVSTGSQRPIVIPAGGGSGTIVVPAVGQVQAAAKKDAKAQEKIIIKQTVKQEVAAKKARRKRATQGTRQTLKSKRAEYAQAKKDATRRLRDTHKKKLKEAIENTKSLPKKEQGKRRKLLRSEWKTRLQKKLKELKPIKKKTYEQLEAMVKAAKSLTL